MITNSEDTAPATSLRCPKCGYVMCQQFNSRPVNALAEIATPNGQYVCYYCSDTASKLALAPSPTTAADARERAREIVGTVFDNTAASPETLKQVMIERIASALPSISVPTESAVEAAAKEIYTRCWPNDEEDAIVILANIVAIIKLHLQPTAGGDTDAEG